VNDVLRAILIRADLPDAQLFAANEVARWPGGALDWLMGAGILREAEPAEEILCEECEEGCWIKPAIREDPQTHQRVGTYFCRRNEDIGPFKVDLSRRQRWAFSLGGLAKVVSKAVKPTGKVTELAPERLALLGTVKLDGKNRELFLARGVAWPDAQVVFGGVVRLKTASHPAMLTVAGTPLESLLSSLKVAARPLTEIATLDEKGLHVSIEGAFPDVEPRPWADIPNQPVTLDEFMAKYCEKRTEQSRRSRRRALLGAARNHKDTIKMPALAGSRKSGQSNKYFVHDLLKAWQGFLDEDVGLPPLLP
jgi:hypothetical protein